MYGVVAYSSVRIGNWIYYTIADLHNLQSLHTNLLSLFPVVFITLSLATDL
jgi:hypothetical protein